MKKLLVFALLSLNILALDFYVGVNANAGATEWNPKATKIEKKEYKVFKCFNCVFFIDFCIF